MTPYYQDDTVTLYHGDCRDVLPKTPSPALVHVVIADPPYGETSLAWDHWPNGWLQAVAHLSDSLWCFGSLRMFILHTAEFAGAGWHLSQDIIWQKQNGTGFTADRFRRVHEQIMHCYRGRWDDLYHEVPRIHSGVREKGRVVRGSQPPHRGDIGKGAWTDDGTRMLPSVIEARNLHRYGAEHPTQKPIGILMPLIKYSSPPGGLVLDPFAGSGSTLVAAKQLGRHSIGIEIEERYCEVAAKRLAQGVLAFDQEAPHAG